MSPGEILKGTAIMKHQTIAIALGALFFFLLPWHPYPLSFVLKASGILLLAFIAWRSGAPRSGALALALVFGAGGDIFLDLGQFVAGLTSFLLSHVIYIALFAGVLSETGHRGRKALPALVGLIIAAVGLLVWLYPSLSPLTVPVVIYFGVLTAMVALSYIVPFLSLRVAIGASLFFISDVLIGVTRFQMEIPFSHQIIWVTYFAAQYLIATGVLMGWGREKL